MKIYVETRQTKRPKAERGALVAAVKVDGDYIFIKRVAVKGRFEADGGSGSGSSDRVEMARGGCVMVPERGEWVKEQA